MPSRFLEGAAGRSEDRHGISSATCYEWKAKHGGLEISEAKLAGHAGGRDTKLKSLLPETTLDNAILSDSYQMVTSAAMREAVVTHTVSERRARTTL